MGLTIGLKRAPVRERRQFSAHFGQIVEVNIGDGKTWTVRRLGQDLPPGIHNHGMAVGSDGMGGFAKLVRGYHIGLVFNGPGSQ